jgi:hypothetical protein
MSRRPSLPQPSSGISRVDQKSTRTHGYVGRLGYRQTETGWRPAFKAFFGDASNNGPEGALKAAETWLRRTRRELASEVKAGGALAARPGRPVRKIAGAKRAKAGAGGAKSAAVRKTVARKSGTVRVAARKKKAAARAR